MSSATAEIARLDGKRLSGRDGPDLSQCGDPRPGYAQREGARPPEQIVRFESNVDGDHLDLHVRIADPVHGRLGA